MTVPVVMSVVSYLARPSMESPPPPPAAAGVADPVPACCVTVTLEVSPGVAQSGSP